MGIKIAVNTASFITVNITVKSNEPASQTPANPSNCTANLLTVYVAVEFYGKLDKGIGKTEKKYYIRHHSYIRLQCQCRQK